ISIFNVIVKYRIACRQVITRHVIDRVSRWRHLDSMESIYRVEGGIAETGACAGGPWDPKLQHGAAPAALACWAIERMPSAAPMRVVRLTIDLLRPVPVAPLIIETGVLREGRKIQLVGVRLLVEGIEVVRASALRVRRHEQALPSTAFCPPSEMRGP